MPHCAVCTETESNLQYSIRNTRNGLKSNAIQWELWNDEEFVVLFWNVVYSMIFSSSVSCANYGIGFACLIWWHFLNPDSRIKIKSNARGLKILELLKALDLNYFQRFGWLKSLIVGVLQDIGTKSFINWQCIPTISCKWCFCF